MIRVLEAGIRSTVQDGGRLGHLRSGVPAAGPADPFAFAAAQALVGNGEGDAAIEIVGLPFTFSCDDRRVVAVSGPDVSLRARSRVPGWTAALARPDEEYTLVGGERARYAYLAVSGGIALAPALGSRATYLPASLGPLPRALAPGDRLPLGDPRVGTERAGTSLALPSYDRQVRALRGPHLDRFAAASLERFFAGDFTVLAESDRMGVRLAGPSVEALAGELLTCGVVAGAVQVPRGGAPIVLLADAQTTGGYPVIATVGWADLGRVAQAAPTSRLRFYEVERAALVEARREARALLARIA